MRLRFTSLVAMVAGALLSTAATAQPKPAATGGKSIIRFDGDNIDGDLQRPDGDLMSARPRPAMPSLVQPPRSFDRASRRTLMAAAAALEPQLIEEQRVKEQQIHSGKEGSDVGRGTRTSGSTR